MYAKLCSLISYNQEKKKVIAVRKTGINFLNNEYHGPSCFVVDGALEGDRDDDFLNNIY